jgi:hypothetical protein
MPPPSRILHTAMPRERKFLFAVMLRRAAIHTNETLTLQATSFNQCLALCEFVSLAIKHTRGALKMHYGIENELQFSS